MSKPELEMRLQLLSPGPANSPRKRYISTGSRRRPLKNQPAK